MDVKLKVLSGKHAGMMIPLAGPKFLIGRSEDCQLRTGSDLISRHHCALLIRDSYVGIEDFGSRNGTQVNGESICQETELHAGDMLKVGPLEFEVVTEFTDKAKKRPPVKDVEDMAARTATAKSNKSDDDDISDWLGEPEARTQNSSRWSAAETKLNAAANSETVKMNAASDTSHGTPAKGENSGVIPNQTGKLPKYEAPKPVDSSAAAEMALKKLGKRH